MSPPLYGVVAEFDSPEALTRAARAARRAGYTRLDAFSPFPIAELADLLGFRRRVVTLAAVTGALVGGGIQYAMQYWMNVIDYPLNVGGRPLHSWPAFVLPTIIVSLLWAAVAIFLTLLAVTRLPRLHHPVFDTPGFARASEDGFFLAVLGEDARFDRSETGRFLAGLGARAVHEVGR